VRGPVRRPAFLIELESKEGNGFVFGQCLLVGLLVQVPAQSVGWLMLPLLLLLLLLGPIDRSIRSTNRPARFQMGNIRSVTRHVDRDWVFFFGRRALVLMAAQH
jgi:hypothetical protein